MMPTENPFPGMNPYLERHWGDIHHRLVMYACDQLQERLPGRLRARVEERVFVESDEGWLRNVYPDLRVIERPHGRGRPGVLSSGDAGVAIAEPLILRQPHQEITEGFIEIRDGESGNRVITVIEVLSPSNKGEGEGAALYKKKQEELAMARVSLVEIDLLRDGKRVIACPSHLLPSSHHTPYLMCVRRGEDSDCFEVYGAALREKLPTIGIPLRPSDPDAALDLQALINQAYRMGRYDDIDYMTKPTLPLDEEDARWAKDLLIEKGLRARPAGLQ